MRPIIIALLFSTLYAAEAAATPREVFTLTDGRTITGTYHEADNALLLDGGKAMLHITPDQIAKRAPAPPEAERGEPLSKKGKSAEDKAAAMAAFKKANEDKAGDAREAEANKAEKEAADLLAKADAYKAKALVVAKSFQERAKAEGEVFTIESILRDPIMVKKTSATNAAILGLMKDAERFTKESVEKQDFARSRRQGSDGGRGNGGQGAGRKNPDPRMSGPVPETIEECRRLADELEAEEVRIRVRPVNDPGLDPAWIEGTPEYNARQAKVDESMKRINQLRRAALFMEQKTAPPEDRLHQP